MAIKYLDYLGLTRFKEKLETIFESKGKCVDKTTFNAHCESANSEFTSIHNDITTLQAAMAEGVKVQAVTTLPTENIDTKTIYLVPSSTDATNDIYYEYIYVNGVWEMFGQGTIHLYKHIHEGENTITIFYGESINDDTGYKLTLDENGFIVESSNSSITASN